MSELTSQHELELEIYDHFIRSAKEVLDEELKKLRKEVGTVPGMFVTGSVGVQFHSIGLSIRILNPRSSQ